MPNEFESNSKKFDNWFDFAGFCYDYIINKLNNCHCTEAVFLSTYIYSSNFAKTNNPNRKMLIKLSEEIKNIVEYSSRNGIDLDESIQNIFIVLSKKKLESYENPELNNLTPFYFVISGIDRFYWDNKDLLAGIPNQLVSDISISDSYVYSKNVWNIYKSNAKFSELSYTEISKQFISLHFIRKEKLDGQFGIPNIVSLLPDIKNRPMVWKEIKDSLKVAIIPITGCKTTTFSFPTGALMKVEYPPEYNDKVYEKVLKLLIAAIENDANIIIFPEYIISPQIQYKLSQYLSEKYANDPKSINKLLVVFAGSGWTEDNNNVSHILDYKGVPLGKYYKRSNYCEKASNPQCVEGLSSPGKECTMVDIPDIGRILPAICRDVVNQVDIDILVSEFQPFAIAIPAWSSSIRGAFEESLNHYASHYLVTSFLCNCCEALHCKEERQSERTVSGYVTVPVKDGQSAYKGNLTLLKREVDCHLLCNDKSCIYLVNLNYTKESFEDDVLECHYTQKMIKL